MPTKETEHKVTENLPETAPDKPVQEKILHTWQAPSRPFKRRTREFYVTVIAIAALFALVMFAVDGFFPVILIIAIVFLVYVMSTVEPETIEYKITNYGVRVAGNVTPWMVMGRFWFTRRFDSQLLVIETATVPGRLELVINKDEQEKIKKEISEYLVYEEVPASVLDNAANWFSKKLPGEK